MYLGGVIFSLMAFRVSARGLPLAFWKSRAYWYDGAVNGVSSLVR